MGIPNRGPRSLTSTVVPPLQGEGRRFEPCSAHRSTCAFVIATWASIALAATSAAIRSRGGQDSAARGFANVPREHFSALRIAQPGGKPSKARRFRGLAGSAHGGQQSHHRVAVHEQHVTEIDNEAVHLRRVPCTGIVKGVLVQGSATPDCDDQDAAPISPRMRTTSRRASSTSSGSR
jgi:hypothetical protein